MQSQDVAQLLNHSELRSLQAISRCGDISPYVNYDDVLHRLIELRLIEEVSEMWMPLEMKHDCYKLTPLGHDVISECEKMG